MQPYCDFIKKSRFFKKKEKKREVRIGLRLQALLELGVVNEVLPVSDPTHEKGKTYWSGECQKWYTVTDVCYTKSGFREAVMIEWEDGKRGVYPTKLDKERDFEIVLEKYGDPGRSRD